MYDQLSRPLRRVVMPRFRASLSAEDETPPRMAEEGSWRDVTTLCDGVAAKLGMEEMMEAPSFSLYDAMSALELMNPRMDVLPKLYPSMETMLTVGQVRVSMSEEEALRVCGGLWVREMRWAEGAAFEDSVRECVFASPEGYAALRSHFEATGERCAGAVLACVALALDVVRAARLAILHADVYEEEDYGPTPAGCAECLGQEEAVMLATRVEALLDGALLDHVRCRRYLALSVANLMAFGRSGTTPAASADLCLEAVAALEKRDHPTDDDESFVAFFADKRPGKAMPMARSFEVFRSLARGLRRVAELRVMLESEMGCLSGAPGEERTLEEGEQRALFRVLTQLQRVQLDGCGRLILPRSLAAVELGSEVRRAYLNGETEACHGAILGRGPRAVVVFDLVDDSLRSAGAPTVVAAAPPAVDFIAESCAAVLEVLRSLCQNRARIHQRLRPLLLENWATVLAHAGPADVEIAKTLGLPLEEPSPHRYMQTWAIRVAIFLMELLLELHVELQLTVSPTELEPLYFYREYLATSELRMVAVSRRYKDAVEAELRGVDRIANPLADALEIFLDAKRLLCRAMHLLTTAIINADEPRFRTLKYGSFKARYNIRFKHFACLSEPPYVTYEQFVELTTETRSVPVDKLLDIASDFFQRSKKRIDQLLKIEQLPIDRDSALKMAKVAVANRITCAKIKMRTTTDHNWYSDLDLRFHPHFPVLSHR